MRFDAGDVLIWIVVVVLLFLWYVGVARAHEAHSGWSYPSECCGGSDCAEAIDIKPVEGGRVITTKHGKAFFPNNFPIRSSQDEKTHACFNPALSGLTGHYNGLYCLFEPAGS